MENQTSRNPSNILLTLPSQTEASFWIIVIVILGTMLSSVFSDSPIYMLPIALSMFILPIRTFLAWPEKELRRQDKIARAELSESGTLQALQQAIDMLAADIGYKKHIQIVISRHPWEARAFGTWRRHYILLGADLVKKLVQDLQSDEHCMKAQALLLHEIGHLVHRDVQREGYSRKLLRSCFVVISWWMLFLIGWLGFSWLSVDALLNFDISQYPQVDPLLQSVISSILTIPPETRAEIIEKTKTISFGLVLNFIVVSFVYIVEIGFLLWLFYWRRMMRLREYYADQLVYTTLQDREVLFSAMGRYVGLQVKTSQKNSKTSSTLGHFAGFRDKLTNYVRSNINGFVSSLPPFLMRFFRHHPTPKERHEHLNDPSKIYSDWLGVGGGIVVIGLSLALLSGMFAIPYGLQYTYMIELSAIFILLGTSLLPFIVMQESLRGFLTRVLLVAFGIRSLFVIFDRMSFILAALLAPDFARDVINMLILAAARYSKPIDTLPVNDPLAFFVSSLPIYFGMQLLLPFLAVGCFLIFYYYLQKGALSVEADSSVINWQKRHWGNVIGLSIAIITLFVAPLADIFNGDFSALVTPSRLIGYIIGVVSCIGLFITFKNTKNVLTTGIRS